MLEHAAKILRAARFLPAVAAVCLLAAPIGVAQESGEKSESGDKPVVEMKTNVGTMVIELWPSKAPKTVENFLQYARDGFYDGTIFHRVVKGFVIQGGGYTEDMTKKETRAPIELEAKAPNEQYTLSMARTQDPNSATSQFFVNLQRNPALDGSSGRPGYAVFGKVIEGQGVVDQIARTQTTNKGRMQNVPVTPIVIEKVTVR
jgi:peptidyl-prolyl cis-trans isomerase A (cyclophilin A)